MGHKHIYIISDLHLGGAPAGEQHPGFQMCPPESRRKLAQFINYVSSAHRGDDTELVINGDFVDFLAEEPVGFEGGVPCEAFTPDSTQAIKKLHRIIKRTDEGAGAGERVFEALSTFVAKGHKLTILVGNHDVELSLPSVRRTLVDVLAQERPSRIELLLDGEAYTVGNLLIEHGNRYDGWNVVCHGLLRAYRSCLSRGEKPPFIYCPSPGSSLVAELMNPLKKIFKFIDLLKPENEALIPILVAIEPKSIRSLKSYLTFIEKLTEATRLSTPSGAVPMLAETIAATDSITAPAGIELIKRASVGGLGEPAMHDSVVRTRALLVSAEQEWGAVNIEDGVANQIAGATDTVKGILYFISQLLPIPDEIYARLDRTLQAFREVIQRTFDIREEATDYLDAAQRLSEGRRVIVFGHTHLAKRIPLAGKGLYFNTGTWCPLIQLPSDALAAELAPAQRRQILHQFVHGLRDNELSNKQYSISTFVKATVSTDGTEAELFEWKLNGTVEVFNEYYHG